MIGSGYFESDSTSPTADFAFQLPQEQKLPPSLSITPSFVPYTLSSYSAHKNTATGPFTMSGTVTPVDLSLDTAAANNSSRSREFAVPDNRRPTTYNSHRRDEDCANGFHNPFSSPAEMVPSQSASVDPHYQQPETSSTASWHSSATSQPLSAYPATAVNVSQGYYSNGLLNPANRTASVSRPQTSDGLPSYPTHLGGGSVSLPSARSMVGGGGYSSGVSVSPTYSTGGQMMTGYPPTGRYGSYDQNAGRYVSMQSGNSDLQFVTLPGGSIPPRKRSRRRYDEIERIYHCEYKGCDKAYGTLNHLNAHVAMQKHGEKRLPVQFKEMRKEWRRKKREEVTEAANKELQAHAAAAQQAAAHHQAAASHHHASSVDPGSAGGYHWGDSRHTTADPTSLYSSYSTSSSNSLGVDSDPYGHRDSTSSLFSSTSTWSNSDTPPTTANTISSGGSPNDGRFAYGNGSWSNVYDRKPGMTPLTTPQSATGPSTFNLYGMNHHSIV